MPTHRGPERLALSRWFAVSLSIGVDFREHFTRGGQRLRYFVAVIGEQCLTIRSKRRRSFAFLSRTRQSFGVFATL